MTHQYLTFLLHGEVYAVALNRVKDIIEYETVTRVPTVPPHIRGVIDVRGTVVPVIDLSAKFGHGESEPTATTCIIMVESHIEDKPISAGVIADAVSQVLDIPSDQIVAPPSLGTQVRVDFLAAMAKLDGRIALILDLDRILTPLEAQEALDAVAAAESDLVATEDIAPLIAAQERVQAL